MLTEKYPNMRDSQMPLAQRIDAALARITRGDCSMRIPVEATDPDIVLSDCKELLAAKDRDLSDANHALLLANNSADAFRRVAERHKRAIDWLLRHGAFRRPDGVIEYRAVSADMDVTGAEFEDILKPTTGASNAKV